MTTFGSTKNFGNTIKQATCFRHGTFAEHGTIVTDLMQPNEKVMLMTNSAPPVTQIHAKVKLYRDQPKKMNYKQNFNTR